MSSLYKRRFLDCFRAAEVLVVLQLIVTAIGVYIAYRSHRLAREERGSCVLNSNPNYPHKFSSSRVFRTGNPALPLTSGLCASLFIVDALGAQSETGAAQSAQQAANAVQQAADQAALSNNTYGPTTNGLSNMINNIGTNGYVSEEQELAFLVSVLKQYYLFAYNMYWTGQVSGANPFTNNQCLSIIEHQTDQIKYEKLSQDIEGYAALSVKVNKPMDVQYALVMAYFITRVRIIQIQNATLDLGSAAVYSSATDTITFQPQFISVVVPQLGPKTKALISSGSCTPTQLASTMLQPGEHNPTFDNISSGKKPYTFICGSAS